MEATAASTRGRVCWGLPLTDAPGGGGLPTAEPQACSSCLINVGGMDWTGDRSSGHWPSWEVALCGSSLLSPHIRVFQPEMSFPCYQKPEVLSVSPCLPGLGFHVNGRALQV